MSNDLLELLAEVEHERWSHWMRYFLENVSPENLERWKRQMNMSYAELSEKEKDSDRREANVTLAVLRDSGYLVLPKPATLAASIVADINPKPQIVSE